MKNVLRSCGAVLTLSAFFVPEVFGADRSVPPITPEQIEAYLSASGLRPRPCSHDIS